MDRKSIAQRLLKLRGTTPRRQVATACNIKLTALANYAKSIKLKLLCIADTAACQTY